MVRALSIILVLFSLAGVCLAESPPLYIQMYFEEGSSVDYVKYFHDGNWNDTEFLYNSSNGYSNYVTFEYDGESEYLNLKTNRNDGIENYGVPIDSTYLSAAGKIILICLNDGSWKQYGTEGFVNLETDSFSADYTPPFGPSLPSLNNLSIDNFVDALQSAVLVLVGGVFGSILSVVVLKKGLSWAKKVS